MQITNDYARVSPFSSTRDPSSSGRLEGAAAGAAEPDPEAKAVIAELKREDREVRAHEAAHAAAGGAYVRGGPSYQYTQGPDGRRYASGGEVQIDTSPVAGDPRATVAKMQQVRRAALAPARPSGQDLAVAASAARAESEARAQLTQEPSRAQRGLLVNVRA